MLDLCKAGLMVPPTRTEPHLFVLESSLADNNIFNGRSTAKPLLVNRILFVDLLTALLGKVVQSILVYHPGTVMLVRLKKKNFSFLCVGHSSPPLPRFCRIYMFRLSQLTKAREQ